MKGLSAVDFVFEKRSTLNTARMPLPRVAGMAGGRPREPVRTTLDGSTARAFDIMSKDSTFARENVPSSEHRALHHKERSQQGSVGSIIFGAAGPKYQVKTVSTYITSQDHPLFVPAGVGRPAGMRVRPPPAPAPTPTGMAGSRTSRSVPLGSVMYGEEAPPPGAPSGLGIDRSLTQLTLQPRYQVQRSSRDSGAKDLLYPAPPPPPASQADDGASSAPMLHAAFESLREHFSQIPRDASVRLGLYKTYFLLLTLHIIQLTLQRLSAEHFSSTLFLRTSQYDSLQTPS